MRTAATAITSVQPLGAAVSTSPGLRFYNGAVSGTRASNYLSETARQQLSALRPDLVIHMVGTNDFASGVTAQQYANDLEGALAAIDQVVGEPLHLLLHSFQRMDSFSPSSSWAEFGAAVADVSGSGPRRRHVDVSQEFAELGVPGPDPAGLVGADRIHLTDTGYTMLGDIVAESVAAMAGV